MDLFVFWITMRSKNIVKVVFNIDMVEVQGHNT